MSRYLKPALLSSLLALGGCGAIETLGSGKLPEDQKASISGAFFLTHLGPSRVTVRPLASDEVGLPSVGFPGKVNMPAGRRTLFVNRCSAAASMMSCREPWLAEFEAEAGREYRIRAGGDDHYWIVEAESGRLVADSKSGGTQAVATARRETKRGPELPALLSGI